jgi:hypothetical protein
MKARFAQFGASSIGGSAADFAELIAATEKWAELVRSSGMRPE